MFTRFVAVYSKSARIVLDFLVLFTVLNIGAFVIEKVHPEKGVVLDFDYAPYRMMKQVHGPWPLNDDGFRAPPLAQLEAHSGDFFNIVFIGGSVCLGAGGENGAPLPQLVEEMLRKKGMGKIRVINLCQGGTVTAQEFAIFLQYGLPLEPALLVSFNGSNDLFHPAPIGFDEKPNLPYLDDEMRALWTQGRLGAGLTSALRSLPISHLLRRVNKHFRMHPASGPGVSVEEAVGSYVFGLDLTARLARSYKIPYAVFLQPTLYVAKKIHHEELERISDPFQDPKRVSERANQLYALARKQLTTWSGKSGVRLFDLTQTYRDTAEPLYSDSVHFGSALGYQLLLANLGEQGFVSYVEGLYGRWASTHH